MKKNPIGIFDSGIGGLTVAKAIHELMPHERIVYYGDTLHLPYGDKSPLALKHYAEQITRFLLSKGAKAIIVACNTASAVAFSTVLKTVGKKALCLSVIDPVIGYLKHNQANSVAVIATKTTISSGVYPKRIQKEIPQADVYAKATPLLAPMIEEGLIENDISASVIRHYIADENILSKQHLILGCTHYPLIEDEIKSQFGSLEIINSAQLVAESLKAKLQEQDILADQVGGKSQFIVSDYTPHFEKQARLFFGENIHLKKESIWNE